MKITNVYDENGKTLQEIIENYLLENILLFN